WGGVGVGRAGCTARVPCTAAAGRSARRAAAGHASIPAGAAGRRSRHSVGRCGPRVDTCAARPGRAPLRPTGPGRPGGEPGPPARGLGGRGVFARLFTPAKAKGPFAPEAIGARGMRARYRTALRGVYPRYVALSMLCPDILTITRRSLVRPSPSAVTTAWFTGWPALGRRGCAVLVSRSPSEPPRLRHRVTPFTNYAFVTRMSRVRGSSVTPEARPPPRRRSA